jgi:hypothetical protein
MAKAAGNTAQRLREVADQFRSTDEASSADLNQLRPGR